MFYQSTAGPWAEDVGRVGALSDRLVSASTTLRRRAGADMLPVRFNFPSRFQMICDSLEVTATDRSRWGFPRSRNFDRATRPRCNAAYSANMNSSSRARFPIASGLRQSTKGILKSSVLFLTVSAFIASRGRDVSPPEVSLVTLRYQSGE
jgi:hypothetical protein